MTFGDDAGGTAGTADRGPGPFVNGSHTPVSPGHARDARVREDNTSTSVEPSMSDCVSPERTAEGAADTDSHHEERRAPGLVGRLWLRLWARCNPPDIWLHDRPSLQKVYAYAHHGEGAPKDGPLRDLQLWWYRHVARPVIARAYWQAWLIERPFRGFPVLIGKVVWWALSIATFIHFLP